MPNRPFARPAPHIAVLIPAAGSGSRMGQAGAPGNKLLLPLGGEPLLRHTVRAFHDLPVPVSLHIVARPEDFDALERGFSERECWPHLRGWIEGGTERQDSVRLGLEALAADTSGAPDWVLVHDGARPLCSPSLIQRVLDALRIHAAVVPVVPVFDTVRKTGPTGQSEGVLDRSGLRLCQTPQGFHWNTLWQAHLRAQADGFVGTDDGQLVERLGQEVALVAGERRNLKVTLPDDVALAEWVRTHPDWGTALP
jgi:2-C-methyl-D-erythritol 4-phosphate cytidylyltransferase